MQLKRKIVWPSGKFPLAAMLIFLCSFQIACNDDNKELPSRHVITTEAPANQVETEDKQVVEIRGMKFNPSHIQAAAGDTIVFVNKDLVPHNVTDRETNDTLSPQIDPSKDWMLIVTKNLHFYCSIHPNMEGEIELLTP